jgi:hypothetical protein
MRRRESRVHGPSKGISKRIPKHSDGSVACECLERGPGSGPRIDPASPTTSRRGGSRDREDQAHASTPRPDQAHASRRPVFESDGDGRWVIKAGLTNPAAGIAECGAPKGIRAAHLLLRHGAETRHGPSLELRSAAHRKGFGSEPGFQGAASGDCTARVGRDYSQSGKRL